MGNNPSIPKVTAQDKAILDLKLQRDKVKQYQKKIQAVLDREHEIAKQQLASGNKDRALLALRRRKYQESLLAKTDGQLENLEGLVSTIEFSLIQVSVVHGLQQGNEVLKKIHEEMSLEKVERILDDTQEAQAFQKEISEMLAGNLTAEDEEAVEDELAALQRELLGVEEPVAPLPELPTVPSAEPVAPESAEEPAEEGRQRIPVAA